MVLLRSRQLKITLLKSKPTGKGPPRKELTGMTDETKYEGIQAPAWRRRGQRSHLSKPLNFPQTIETGRAGLDLALANGMGRNRSRLHRSSIGGAK